MVYPAVEAGERLDANGISITVANARFVKPLDMEMIMSLAREHDLIFTVEEAYLAGGFGSAVLELLESHGLQDSVKVIRMGVADEIVTHGDPKKLLAVYGLNAAGIAERISTELENLSAQPVSGKRLRVVK